ncbi:SapC family protein [Pseudomonadota bacterium]
MTNAVLLDSISHKDLRIRTGYSAEFGDNINTALVFPTEFVYIQREYPIFFRKDSNGAYQAIALLGLDRDENLFLDEPAWNARYVPALHQRGPFLIGLHQTDPDREPMVHVRLDHPRISTTEGEPVFLPHGGHSPLLAHTNRMLQIIYHGDALARPMFAAFEETGLIESIQAEVNLDERVKYTLPDFFTISQEALEALDGATLERLNRSGYLQLAIFVLNSLGNIEWLIELKNRKRLAGRA